MLKGKMSSASAANSGSAARVTLWSFREVRSHEAWFREDHRGDRFLRASARRLPTRRQTRLHQRRLNSSLRLEMCDAAAPSPRGVLAYATPRRLPFRLMSRYLSSDM